MSDVEVWGRPHYVPGGDDAVLVYFVFGQWDEELEISRSKYRAEGLPSGIDVVKYDRATQPEEFNSLLHGYVLGSLQAEFPDMYKQVQNAPSVVRIQGTVPDPETLDYLRNIIGFITAVLDQGGVAVLDLLALQWWTPQDWRCKIFEPDDPSPTNDVTILISQEKKGRQWFHTRGMRKFGRPDISVRNVPPESADAVIALCNCLIIFMAFGSITPEGQEVRMEGLPPGMRCHHAGNHDDLDFNNVHIEIRYPDAARQERRSFWPWKKP